MWVCIELCNFLQNIRTIAKILLTLCHAYHCWQQPAVTWAANVFQYNCDLCVYGSIENGTDLVSGLQSTLWCHKLHERYGVWSKKGHFIWGDVLRWVPEWMAGLRDWSHNRAWVSMPLSQRYIFNCWAEPNYKQILCYMDSAVATPHSGWICLAMCIHNMKHCWIITTRGH